MVPPEHSAGNSAPNAAPVATVAEEQTTGSSEPTPESVAHLTYEAAEKQQWAPEHNPEDWIPNIGRLRLQIEHADALAALIVAASPNRASQYQVVISVARDAYRHPDASIASLTAAYNADRHAEQINFDAAGWLERRARETPTKAVLDRALEATEGTQNARLMAQTIRLHGPTWTAVKEAHPVLGEYQLRRRLQAHDLTDPDPEWLVNPRLGNQVFWTEHPAVRLQQSRDRAEADRVGEDHSADDEAHLVHFEQDGHGRQRVPPYSPAADARPAEAPAVFSGEAPPSYHHATARSRAALPPFYETVFPPVTDEPSRDERVSTQEIRGHWLATNTFVDL